MIFSARNIIIGIVVAVLAVAIPVTIRLAREQQQLRSQALEGNCRDNPVTPEPGYKWVALCGSLCSNNSQCPRGADNQEGWCFGFDNGNRCLQLQYVGATAAPSPSPSPTPTPTPTPGNVGIGTVTISGKVTEAADPSKGLTVTVVLFVSRAGQTQKMGEVISGGGSFTFVDLVKVGERYAVRILAPPAGYNFPATSPSAGQWENQIAGSGDCGQSCNFTFTSNVQPIDYSTCTALTVDGVDLLSRGKDLLILPGVAHTVEITTKNTSFQPAQNKWSGSYYLKYAGSAATQIGINPTEIKVSDAKCDSVPVGIGQFCRFTTTITPAVPPGGQQTYDFSWFMYNSNNQPFNSPACTPSITISTKARGPETTCPVGSPVQLPGDIDPTTGQRTRFWSCQPPGVAGCQNSPNTTPASPDLTKTCPTGTQCYACLSASPAPSAAPAYNVGQCGLCRNNTTANAQVNDPDCREGDLDDIQSRCSANQVCQNTRCLDRSRVGDCRMCTIQAGIPTNCIDVSDLCIGNSKGPVCSNGICGPALVSPSPTASPSPTPPPTPAPVRKTLCFAIGEGPEGKSAVDAVTDCANIDNKLVFAYVSEPFKITGFTFKDQTPGIKTIFVKFIGLLGSATVTDSRQLSIRFTPNPTISNASCTHSSSGVGTDITIVGANFGVQGKGKAKVRNQEITPDSWDGTTNTITGRVEQRLEGRIPLEVTTDEGRVAKGECVVNTTTITFKTLFACKVAGSFAASNVDVRVFEAVPLTTGTQTPEPLLRQKISLNKDGEPQNFAPKFEKKKKYQLIIKAPGTIARRVDFDTKDGGTTNLEGAISLPQGDIAPANSPDGKINALDKSELIRQWNIVTDVDKTADLNGDSRVNSIDYACMRVNFNATDDTYSAPTASPSPTATPLLTPSPSATSSATPSATPAGGTLFRVSFDPTFTTIDKSGTVDPVTGETIIDLTLPAGPGVKNVYVQFSEDGGTTWGPTPPSVATITLL